MADGRLIIWGAGELGARVAALWAKNGPVLAYTRTDARHKRLRELGAEPRTGSPAGVLTSKDTLLLSLPGSDRQALAVAQLTGAPIPSRTVLISSTGYYGAASGRVDERTPAGRGERAARVAGVENAFRAWDSKGVILRLGGLYRPGRGPLSALLRRGEAPLGPPNRTLALIHYDDAARATYRALRHQAPQDTYLVVVPPCPTRQAFYQAACVLLDLPLPTFSPTLKQPPADYDIARMRADLLPEPLHQRWQEALIPDPI